MEGKEYSIKCTELNGMEERNACIKCAGCNGRREYQDKMCWMEWKKGILV